MTLKFSTAEAIDWNATGLDQLKNNILNILRTRLGEVPYMPTLGIDFDHVDTPLLQHRAVLVAEVRQQLNRWEPSAMLDDLSIRPDDTGNYNVEVVISL